VPSNCPIRHNIIYGDVRWGFIKCRELILLQRALLTRNLGWVRLGFRNTPLRMRLVAHVVLPLSLSRCKINDNMATIYFALRHTRTFLPQELHILERVLPQDPASSGASAASTSEVRLCAVFLTQTLR
jgi:hypothetical protein